MTNGQIDFTVDKKNLYREENIIDLKSASIRCLTPIKQDGTIDDSRDNLPLTAVPTGDIRHRQVIVNEQFFNCLRLRHSDNAPFF